MGLSMHSAMLRRYIGRSYRAILAIKSPVMHPRMSLTQDQQWLAQTPSLRRALSSSARDGEVPVPVPGKTRRMKKQTPVLPIATLDPQKLRVQDMLDISGMTSAVFNLSSGGYSPDKRIDGIVYKNDTRHYTTVRRPFPPGTVGFLYFHRRSPRPHVAAGEIRFRVVQPKTAIRGGDLFSQGSDLLAYGDNSPWRIHLINVFKRHIALRHLLIAGGFINGEEEARIDNLLADKSYTHHSRILESIADPFHMDIGYDHPSFVILHKESIYYGRISFLFRRTCKKLPRYYSEAYGGGKILARFEVANFRDKSETPKVKVVLRVLKILEPPEEVSITNQICKEGELVHRYDLLAKEAAHPWAVKPSKVYMTPSSLELLKEMYLKDSVNQ